MQLSVHVCVCVQYTYTSPAKFTYSFYNRLIDSFAFSVCIIISSADKTCQFYLFLHKLFSLSYLFYLT